MTNLQITMRLPEDLVGWIDEHLDDDFPTRSALVVQALRKVKRQQEADQNLQRFLTLRAAGVIVDDDPDYVEWMRTREFGDDDGVPVGVLGEMHGSNA